MDEGRLQELLDKQEIVEVLLRWCRGLDRGDEQLMASAYHPDAFDEHGTTNYTGSAAAAGYVGKHLRAFKRHLHLTLNPLIEVDGDLASAESAMIASLVPNESGPEKLMLAGGRYLDRLERRDGSWRLVHRQMILEWRVEVDQIPDPAWRAIVDRPGSEPFPHAPGYSGRRSREDASYHYLRLG